MRPQSATLPKVQKVQYTRRPSKTIREELEMYGKQIDAMKRAPDFQQRLQVLLKKLNELAMQLEGDICILMLQWILEQCHYETIPNMRCTTLNNLGCAYRRAGKLQLACNTIEQAVELIKSNELIESKAVTYLDLTTVLSQMQQHDRALKVALLAVEIAKSEDPKYMALAMYNLGVVLTELNRIDEAISQLKAAVQFAQNNLRNSRLIEKFQAQYQKVLRLAGPRTPAKNFETHSEHSSHSLQQTKKFVIRKQNFMEDAQQTKQNFYQQSSESISHSYVIDSNQSRESSLMQKVMKKVIVPKQEQSLPVIQKQEPEIVNTAVNVANNFDWSDSEPSDTDVKKIRSQEQIVKVPLRDLSGKQQRLQFLHQNKTADPTLDLEDQIIREVEDYIYNTKNITKIQAVFKRKHQQKSYLKLKQEKYSQGQLLASDELKLRKFQKFMRRKLIQLNTRRDTARKCEEVKIYNDIQKSIKSARKVKFALQCERARHDFNLLKHKSSIIRQSIMHPIIDDKEALPNQAMIYTFALDKGNIKFQLVSVEDKKQIFSYIIPLQDFLLILGLIKQYIAIQEEYQIEETQATQTLKIIQQTQQQFLVLRTIDREYVVEQTANPTEFKGYLKKIASLYEPLIQVKEGKLLVRSVNDHEYQTCEVEIQEDFQKRAPFESLSAFENSKLVKIQSHIRGYLQRTIKLLSKVQLKKVLHRKLIVTLKDEYIYYVKAFHTKKKLQLHYLIDVETKMSTNTLVNIPAMVKDLGEVSRDTLPDWFEYNLKEYSLSYTVDAELWIQRYSDLKFKDKKEYKPGESLKAAVAIQRSIRRYLNVQLHLMRLAKIKKDTTDGEKEVIQRKSIINNGRPCRATFILNTVPIIGLSITGETEQQQIEIRVKPLDGGEKVTSFQQRLFYVLQRTEIYKLASTMLETVNIVASKRGDGFKVITKSSDEILSEERQNNNKRDITLEPRRKLNEGIRMQYEHQIPFDVEPIVQTIQPSNDNIDLTAKQLSKSYKFHKGLFKLRICQGKHIEIFDAQGNINDKRITQFVNNFFPTTEYGTYIEPVLEINPRIKQVRKSYVLREAKKLYEQQTIIDDVKLTLSIFHDEQNEQIIIYGYGAQDYKCTIPNNTLLGGVDLNMEYMNQNIEEILIPQLHIEDERLIFRTDERIQTRLLISQRSFENLSSPSSASKEVDEITLWRSVQIDYTFIKSTQTLVLTSGEHKATFPISDFDSLLVVNRLRESSSRQIIVFMRDIIAQIEQIVDVNNIAAIKPELPRMIREKFARKIQGLLLMKKFSEKLQTYRLMAQATLNISKTILSENGTYISITYVLQKAKHCLLIVFKELNTQRRVPGIRYKQKERHFILDLNLNLSKVQKPRMAFQIRRLDYHALATYDCMKSMEYYQQLLAPLIEIFEGCLDVNYAKFQFNVPADFHLQELEVKKDSIPGMTMSILLKAAVKMQRAYRRMHMKGWFEIKKAREDFVIKKNKHMGQFVKRSYVKLDQWYIVNMYVKDDKTPGSFKYTCELIPQKDINERELNDTKRGYYVWQPNHMFNLGRLTVPEFIMQLMYIDDGQLHFRDQVFENHTFQQQPEKLPESEIIYNNPLQRLIAHEQQDNTLYNVVYSGKEKLTGHVDENNEAQDNTLAISVNLKQVRKLYPQMDPKSGETMRLISKSLIKGIRVSDKGQIQLDQSKIQSSFINVERNKISEVPQRPSQIMRQNQVHFKQPLQKNTMTYAKKKFLVVIQYIERKINKINEYANDEVFQEYEQLYQIFATDLSRKNKTIQWEMTPEEARTLTHQTQRTEIGQELAKRVQVFNDNFIYICIDEQDVLKVKTTQAILFVERIIMPIQERFRTRHHRQNYKDYKLYLKENYNPNYINDRILNDNVYHAVRSLNSKSQFIVIAREDMQLKIVVTAWDIYNEFCSYKIELPKKNYMALLADDKKKCIKALVHFVSFDQEGRRLTFSNPKADELIEFFEDENSMSMRNSSSRRISPRKIKPVQNEQQFFIQQSLSQEASPTVLPNNDEFDAIQEY